MLRQTEDMQNHKLKFHTSTESSDYAYYAMILIIDKMIVCHFASNLSRLRLKLESFGTSPYRAWLVQFTTSKCYLSLTHPTLSQSLIRSPSSFLFQALPFKLSLLSSLKPSISSSVFQAPPFKLSQASRTAWIHKVLHRHTHTQDCLVSLRPHVGDKKKNDFTGIGDDRDDK